MNLATLRNSAASSSELKWLDVNCGYRSPCLMVEPAAVETINSSAIFRSARSLDFFPIGEFQHSGF
jgi:hypothetical protein